MIYESPPFVVNFCRFVENRIAEARDEDNFQGTIK